MCRWSARHKGYSGDGRRALIITPSTKFTTRTPGRPRRQRVSVPHDYTRDLAGIKAPVLLIHGRYDRMVPFEVSIAILNHIADSRLSLLNNCGHRRSFEKPAECAAQVLPFLRGY
jgi:pimeloyl-ACP methyl ester carboxylesterase